jgi:hypothetical protein
LAVFSNISFPFGLDLEVEGFPYLCSPSCREGFFSETIYNLANRYALIAEQWTVALLSARWLVPHQSYRAFFLYRTSMETFAFFLLAVFLSTALVRLMLYQSFFLKGR